LRIVRLGQAFTFVDGRRLLVERASRYDGVGVDAGTIALRDARVVLGATSGSIEIEQVRPDSAKSMSATAWWTGARLEPDQAIWT
jgi:methionyl-tRNA formyltransferase